MKVKEESEKGGLNSTFKKWRSWHLVLPLHGKQNGKQWKLRDFTILGSKITADGDYCHEIKTLVLWKKSSDTPRQNIIASVIVQHPLLPLAGLSQTIF